MHKDKEITTKKIANLYTFSNEVESLPTFSETGNKDWIEYGSDNLYPDLLVDLMNTSAKHNSLIKKKVNMTCGEGFVETPNNKVFIANKAGKEDLNDISYKCGYDQMLYGGYCFAVTWNKARTAVARITYIDYKKVRRVKEGIDNPEVAELQDNGVEMFMISPDWKNYRKEKNRPEFIQGFSEEYKENATQLVYVQEYRPGTDFYSLPDYISSIDWIELDKEIANFHINSVKNGFSPSMIMSFKGGVPSDEEMDEFYNTVEKKYAGTTNASKVFITFSEDSDSAPEFTPIELNSSDERFMNLEDQIQANIIIAHGASPIVAGIATSGKLGSSAEVMEAEMVFQKNVIDSKQALLERGFNKIANLNGIEDLELSGIKSFDDIDPEENTITEDANK